jgi:hypothetical protein
MLPDTLCFCLTRKGAIENKNVGHKQHAQKLDRAWGAHAAEQ